MYRRRREPTAVPHPAVRAAVAPEPLASTDAMLRALGDLFSDAVLILDATGRVTYVNPIAEAFLRTNLRTLDHREVWRRFGSVTGESGLVVSPEDSPFAHGLRSDRHAQIHCVIYHQPNDQVSTLCFVVDPVITERRERVGVIVRWRPFVQRHVSSTRRRAGSDKE